LQFQCFPVLAKSLAVYSSVTAKRTCFSAFGAIGPGRRRPAGVAIDNARLYEGAQAHIARREQAEAALRETDRRKDEFLATLAHELRNPLAPIRQAALISKWRRRPRLRSAGVTM